MSVSWCCPVFEFCAADTFLCSYSSTLSWALLCALKGQYPIAKCAIHERTWWLLRLVTHVQLLFSIYPFLQSSLPLLWFRIFPLYLLHSFIPLFFPSFLSFLHVILLLSLHLPFQLIGLVLVIFGFILFQFIPLQPTGPESAPLKTSPSALSIDDPPSKEYEAKIWGTFTSSSLIGLPSIPNAPCSPTSASPAHTPAHAIGSYSRHLPSPEPINAFPGTMTPNENGSGRGTREEES